MAKFTFTRDYLERQPGPKRRYKDWKAGQTYTMTKQHATTLQEKGYGYQEDVRDSESDDSAFRAAELQAPSDVPE